MSELDTAEPAPEPAEGGNSRRALLTKVGVASAVAAVAGLAASRPAAAANGDTMLVGATNNASATTLIQGGSTLRVNGGTSSGSASVYGFNASTQGVGVRGEASGTEGLGVYGYYSGTTTGIGVKGESDNGVGVQGDGTTFDFWATGTGKILLSGTGLSNPPTTGSTGTIGRDPAGNLWYGVGTNTFRKLAGPASAGAFHAIDPVRVYDSRAALPTQGRLERNTSRVVSVKDARNAGGVVTTADVVPAGATAVAFNITVTGMSAANYLSVVPGNATEFAVSTINWNGENADVANASVVKVHTDRTVKVFAGDQAGATHFIIDVLGYYL